MEEYVDEMLSKWEQYEKLQKTGEDTSYIVEEMLCLTDRITQMGVCLPVTV